jgi:hypothetical protein
MLIFIIYMFFSLTFIVLVLKYSSKKVDENDNYIE